MCKVAACGRGRTAGTPDALVRPFDMSRLNPCTIKKYIATIYCVCTVLCLTAGCTCLSDTNMDGGGSVMAMRTARVAGQPSPRL